MAKVGDKMGLMGGKLVLRMDRENGFKSAANHLAGKESNVIQTLDQNQMRRKEIVNGKRNQVAELIGQETKLILQFGHASRDFGNRKSVFSQQFAQMKQRKSDMGKEPSAGKACR